MMNRDRGSNSAKVHRPRVKASVSSTKLDIPTQSPPLVRSNTLPPNYASAPRVSRNSLGLPEARSDDGFHSDSDKDSNQSANSNKSNKSSKGYLSKPPSIKSSVVAKVRPKSSLGTMSDISSSDKSRVEFDIADLNRRFQADKQAEEARKNRKIEDLEISIQSLTRFNAELEATNKKQAAEIQELKRKLNIDNSLSSIYGSEDEVSAPLSEIDLAEIEKDNDARFRRICMVIDELTQNANKALAYTSKIGGSKVLTNAQLDLNNTEFQNESNKISDGLNLSSSENLMVPKESESNSAEESCTDTIAYKTKPKLNVVNEKTFVNDSKPTTEKDNTNSTTVQSPNNLYLAEVEEKNQTLKANLERARSLANELLSLEKQDNDVNSNNISHNSERKGLGLLLPQNGYSSHTNHSSINGSDSPQPSPRMILLYELQESLGIGNAESSKYLKENRRSLPVMSSNRIHLNVISPPEESENDSRPSTRSQTQSNKFRRRSSPNFRTRSYPPISKKDHTIQSFVEKDDSVLNSDSDVEKRSLWVYLTTPFRAD